MRNNMSKYYPAVIVLYLNYFLHGIGCSVLGQAAIKEVLAGRWGVQVASITAISAALGLGRLLSLPIAGPLSDKLGRKASILIGGLSYAVYLLGIALTPNFQVAYLCAIAGGLANSFLDTGIYPAVAEIIDRAPGIATMGIKFAISISQLLMPFFLGVALVQTTAGASYDPLFYVSGAAFVVLVALLFFMKLPDTDSQPGEKKEGLIASLRHTHFSIESIAMILIGFTCTGTFQLWLNCAQTFAKEFVGFANPAVMQTCYSAGTILALIVTSLLTRKVKDVRFVLVYPAICLATLLAVYAIRVPAMCVIGAFIIGWAGAGGLLQIATSVCNQLFPKLKGTVTALVMIASSLCNYTILTAASAVTADKVILMNAVVTGVGVLLGLFINLRYGKLMENVQK